MSRIGFYGGAFNPPTEAHIELAKISINEFKLDKIVFVPVNDLYKKAGMVSALHRVNMLKLICEKEKNLEVSDIELRNNVNYQAIDIFRKIEKEYNNDEIFFIMGADNLEKIPKWKDFQSLISNYKYIILDRNEIRAEKIIEGNETLRKHKENFYIVKNMAYKDYSSTSIRNKLEEEEIINGLDKDVYAYIKENKLYKSL